MLTKLLALLGVLRKGSALSEPELWRDKTSAANAVVGLLAACLALAAAFGHRLEIDGDDLQALALGLVALVGLCNKLMHVATTADAGLSPKPEPAKTAPLFEPWPELVEPKQAAPAEPEPEPKPDNSVRDGRPPYL